MYQDQDYECSLQRCFSPSKCESQHFTHMCKTLAVALPHHFTKRGGLGPQNYFNPAILLLTCQ
jgi:hypothetical protein